MDFKKFEALMGAVRNRISIVIGLSVTEFRLSVGYYYCYDNDYDNDNDNDKGRDRDGGRGRGRAAACSGNRCPLGEVPPTRDSLTLTAPGVRGTLPPTEGCPRSGFSEDAQMGGAIC